MNLRVWLAIGLGAATAAVAGCDEREGREGREGRAGDGPADTPFASAGGAPAGTAVTSSAAGRGDPAPVLAPAVVAEDRRVGPGLTALAPIVDGALIVVPIASDAPVAGRYLTLDEGMRRGLVSVRELPDTDYGTLRVHNRSELTLCLAAGEVVLEGHQDRTFAESLAVAPRSRAEIDVRCVEPDRSEGPGRRLVSAQAMVHPELRRLLFQGSQARVWEEVKRKNAVHGQGNATNTYRGTARLQHTGGQAEWRDRVLASLAAMPGRERVVGLAVALEGRLIAVDVFAAPELYRALEPKLVGAAVAQGVEARRELRAPRPEEIGALLAGARHTACGQTAMAPPLE